MSVKGMVIGKGQVGQLFAILGIDKELCSKMVFEIITLGEICYKGLCDRMTIWFFFFFKSN